MDFPRMVRRRNARLADASRARQLAAAISRRSLFVLGLIAAALISLLYLNQTSDLATTGYDVADLQSQQQLWQMRNDQLRLNVAQLESLDRVDQVATTRLKLGPPQQQVYVTAPLVAIPTPVGLTPVPSLDLSFNRAAGTTAAPAPGSTAIPSANQ